MKLSDLPPAAREKATRELSRQLGAGNGPTVQPDMERVNAAQDRREAKAAIAETRKAQIQTWYRTADVGDEIKAVQVTTVTPLRITIIQPNGYELSTLKEAPGEHYHQTYGEAWHAVETRLRREVIRASECLKALLERGANPPRPTT